MMKERKRERGNAFIYRELTLALQHEVKDPRVQGVTITEVNLTPDLRVARVYVTSFAGEEQLNEALEGLRSSKGLLRGHLAKVLPWRFTPRLEFYPDRSWQYGAKIDALLASVAEEDKPTEDDGEPG